MCKVADYFGARSLVRFAFAGMTAASLAGCADSSRFIGDPLGNPFHSASNEPPAGAEHDMAPPPPYRPSHVAVMSQPLPPVPSAPTQRVATYETTAHASPRLASSYVPPRTERTASIAAPSGHGSWSADGGMAVIATTNDTAGVLADRYNVPVDALLHTNGLSSAGQVRPGTRLVIPVYNAGAAGASHAAMAEPPRPAHDHSSREKLLAAHDKHDVHGVGEAKIARHEPTEHDKMHWVKGPQPVATLDKRTTAEATKHDGREKALAKLDAKRAEKTALLTTQKQTDSKMAKKAVSVQTPQAASRVQPVQTAEAEQAPIAKKSVIDPTPTASLPPASDKPSTSGNPEFRWPAHGRIIQAFKSGGNDGINIAVPEGTAVKAAESGVVAYAGNEIKGFGNLVLIRHPNGYVTAYANNADLEVHRGEQVKRGQTIAKSGQTGSVASPQLHFEVRKGSTPVDPTRYLAGL